MSFPLNFRDVYGFAPLRRVELGEAMPPAGTPVGLCDKALTDSFSRAGCDAVGTSLVGPR